MKNRSNFLNVTAISPFSSNALNDYAYHLVIVFYPFHREKFLFSFEVDMQSDCKWAYKEEAMPHTNMSMLILLHPELLRATRYLFTNMQHLQAEYIVTGFLMVKKSNCKSLLSHKLRSRSLQFLFGQLLCVATKWTLM